MSRESILAEIVTERAYQESRWGVVGDPAAFDTANTVNDFAAWVVTYLGKATPMDATKAEQRKALLKVAAIAVGALENFDANGGFAARHFEAPRHV